MKIEDLINSMTPQIYRNMKEAVELGRWGDGRTMNKQQKSHCVEAMIRFEHLHGIDETERVGYVDMSNKRKKSSPADETQPLKIIE
ncbi:MAG: DUF1315 family protein [Bermanella sp.]